MNNHYKVIVTQHCKKRALQRLRLYLRQHELADIETFIRKEFKTAHKCIMLNSVPFYKRQVGSEVFVTKFVKFYGVIHKDTIILKTLIKNRGEWRY